MTLRKAYEMVINHQLDILEESGRWQFATDKKEELVKTLNDEVDFHETITKAVEEHLEDFGENYDLF